MSESRMPQEHEHLTLPARAPLTRRRREAGRASPEVAAAVAWAGWRDGAVWMSGGSLDRYAEAPRGPRK